MFDESTFSLNPVHFFALSCDCRYLPKKELANFWAKHLLPSTHSLTNEEHFGDIALGWNEDGIALNLRSTQPAVQSFYPDIEKGDSLELFFDTRDLKTTGVATRFCHHFFFLPEAVEGFSKGEMTRFRSEDQHPLCDQKALFCETELKKNRYDMKIFIPSQCLYGYDPKQFDRLGFTYRINRLHGKPQHFSVVSEDYQIDQQPSLWGSLTLMP